MRVFFLLMFNLFFFAFPLVNNSVFPSSYFWTSFLFLVSSSFCMSIFSVLLLFFFTTISWIYRGNVTRWHRDGYRAPSCSTVSLSFFFSKHLANSPIIPIKQSEGLFVLLISCPLKSPSVKPTSPLLCATWVIANGRGWRCVFKGGIRFLYAVIMCHLIGAAIGRWRHI